MRKFLWGVFVLLLFLNSAAALNEALSVSPEQQSISSCACELRQQSLLVQNIGDVESFYQLSKFGSAAEWLTLSENTFSLRPSEKREVQQFLKVPCAAEGIFDITTAVQTQFGNAKSSTLSLEVKQCADLNIVPMDGPDRQSCPCTPTAFNFQIQNNGIGPEQYTAWVEPQEHTTITQSRFMLAPGELKILTVYVNAPCEIFGKKDFMLYVQAQNAKLIGSHPFSLQIDACYEYGIQLQNQYDICQNVVNTIPFSIKNNAEFQNTYRLEIGGIRWGALDQTVVPLASGDTFHGTLNLDPGNIPPSIYEMQLKVISERGKKVESHPVALNLQTCYDIQLIPESQNPVVVGCEQSAFAVLVQNSGTKQADLSFSFNGPVFSSIDQRHMSLAPAEAKILQEQFTVPCDAEPFTTTLIATFDQLPYLTKELQASFPMVPMAEAYKVEIDAPNRIRTTYEGISVPITFQNLGIKDGRYRIGLTGAEFAQLDQEEIIVPAGGLTTVTLTAVPAAEIPEDDYPLGIAAALVNPYGQVIVYEREITLRVSEKPLWLKLLPYILAFLVLVGIAALLLWQSQREPKRKALVKEGKERKEKPLIKSLKAPVAEKLRFKRKEKVREVRITPAFWKWVLLALLLLLLGLGTYFTTPLFKEELQEAERPVVRIGETDLRVLPGNIVLVTKPSILPLQFVNENKTATYDISVELPDWITAAHSRVTLAPGGEQEMTLDIDPTAQPAGDTPLDFSIAVRGGEAFEETVTIRVVKLAPWQKVLFFLILALLLLLLLLAAVWNKLKKALLRKKVPETKLAKPRIEAPKIFLFAFERIKPIFIPTKGVWERFRERMRRLGWRRILMVLIPLAVILLLSLLGLTTPLFGKAANVTKETYESMAERIKAVRPAEINLTGEELPQEIFLDEDGVIIPLKIRNDDPIAKYLISVKEDIDWISTDKTVLDIAPMSSGLVNIAVAPTAAVKEGKYRVTFDVTLEGRQQLFQKGIILDYQKSLWKKVLLWIVLVALGVVLTIIAIIILRRKEIEKMHRTESKVEV